MVNVYTNSNTPFSASLTTAKGTTHHQVDTARFFVDGLSATLDFFLAGKPGIDRRETLTLMKVLDAARDPRSADQFLPLS